MGCSVLNVMCVKKSGWRWTGKRKSRREKETQHCPFQIVDMVWWATSLVLIRCLIATWPFSAQCFSGSFWIKLYCSRAFETVHFTPVPMYFSETVIPQCFAKAGKMEPNHLLNGFGPLQPAVAMLWWLQELLLLWCLQHNHCNGSGPLLDHDWLMAFLYQQHLECSVIVVSNAKPVSFLTNKETNPSFKTLVLWYGPLSWVLPLCLQWDWYSEHTINGCFKNSRGCSIQKHSTHMSQWKCTAV